MAVISSTQQGSLLERTEAIQTAIVLYVGSKALVADIELARNLGVGTLHELVRQVEINKVVPRTPLVGLELLEGYGCALTAILLIRIQMATKVIMNLHILCINAESCYSHQHQRKKLFHFYYNIYLSIKKIANIYMTSDTSLKRKVHTLINT